MLEHADAFITAGLWLSAVALLAVGVTLWHLWRRASVPEVAYGGVTLAPRRLRWLWTAWLVGATLLGSANDPLIMSTLDTDDPEAQAAASPADEIRRTSTSLPLPFYRYERENVTVGGVPVSSQELRGFVVPTPLLWAFLAYFFLVVRFNPDSRWTRRILHGRKHGRQREGEAEGGAT